MSFQCLNQNASFPHQPFLPDLAAGKPGQQLWAVRLPAGPLPDSPQVSRCTPGLSWRPLSGGGTGPPAPIDLATLAWSFATLDARHPRLMAGLAQRLPWAQPCPMSPVPEEMAGELVPTPGVPGMPYGVLFGTKPRRTGRQRQLAVCL